MYIGSKAQNRPTQAPKQPVQNQEPPKQEQPPKSDEDNRIEKLVDSTFLGSNFTASALAGGVTGTGAWVTTGVPQTFKTMGSALKNLWKTEKLGPTLKFLIAMPGSIAVSLAGGAIAAPVSLFTGIWQGAGEVDSSKPRQFTVSQAGAEGYTKVKKGLNGFAEGIQKEMKELGDYKLEPGEKPVDIPLFQLVQTVAMGAIGAAIGGAAGIVSAAAGTITEAAKGVVGAFGDKNLSGGQKLYAAGTSVLSAPIHGVIYGARTTLGTIGGAMAETWDNNSAIAGAKSMYKDVTQGVAASVAPNTFLTQEKPPEKPEPKAS